jgi:hypothetical protein
MLKGGEDDDETAEQKNREKKNLMNWKKCILSLIK